MNPRRIAFVDSRVAELIPLIREQYPEVKVVEVDDRREGLIQVFDGLTDHSDISAIDIFGHGGPAYMDFGSGRVDELTLRRSEGVLKDLGGRMSPVGAIHLYGCEMAAGMAGQKFVGRLAQETGKAVHAASQKLGAFELGGTWVLDAHSAVTECHGLSVDRFQGILSTYSGTTGNDTLIGTTSDDVFYSSNGRDTLSGGLGNDTLYVTYDYSGYTSASYALEYYLGSAWVGPGSSFGTISGLLPSTAIAYQIGNSSVYSGLATSMTDGFETIVSNLTGTKNSDLLIYQGGSSYDGYLGTDTFYANWSSATAAITWTNTPREALHRSL